MAYRFLFAAALAVCAARVAPAETGFLNRTVTVQGIAYRYVVYVPAGWTANERWPVILFLHGSEEKGDDGLAPSRVGLGRAVRLHPDKYRAVIVMPQCRMDDSWSSDKMHAQALAALDASSREFHGDPQRTYLTGFSMGGYGTWSIAAKYPERFAALVVVCGGIRWPPSVPPPSVDPPADNSYTRTARSVARIPIWIFHGDADRNVAVTESRAMAAALKALKVEVKYTEYAGAAHSIWDRVYDESGLPAWLFSQRLKAVPAR
jgi:predicted peptidase